VRGRYRILLGAAAGVGKTYRMLLEGRQAKAEGVDVVIGYLEPHARPETAALAEKLEVVPRRNAEHRGLALEELDLDTLLRRSPELALIDELAHTNAPGSRNAKRYEDIEEVLAAGTDVISTVNVQHLESLNDTIYELTGVRVRETFPDRILDDADAVVLVDLTPEELQARLQAGRIYPPEQVDRALANFFRLDRLASLRELALREVAEDVEHRRHPSVLDPDGERPLQERILALVTPQASSQRLLRRAWRSAQRLQADIDVLWVRRPGQSLSEQERRALADLRRLAVVLGAHFLEEESEDLVETVRAVARDRGTTYLFLGTPDVRRREEIVRSSLVMRFVRALPGIDVRIVADPARRQV
jgi:two-component system sensor histidine kinase KdpD